VEEHLAMVSILFVKLVCFRYQEICCFLKEKNDLNFFIAVYRVGPKRKKSVQVA